jgi:hypothetical protein
LTHDSWPEATQKIGSEMTDNDGSRANLSDAGPEDGLISDRVQELTWALLDEQINDDEFILLDNLLLSDEKARDSYLGCVQLQADLMSHFAEMPAEIVSKVGSGPRILGFLNSEAPLGFQSPSGEEAVQ